MTSIGLIAMFVVKPQNNLPLNQPSAAVANGQAASKSSDISRGDKVKTALANGAILLDVRTKAEYDFGHFKPAISLPVTDLSAGKMPNVDKATTIYVYCRSGNRSAIAKELLDDAGFQNVIDLGGLESLERLGLDKSDNYQKSL